MWRGQGHGRRNRGREGEEVQGRGEALREWGRNETGDVTTAEGRESRGTRKGWRRWGRSGAWASSGEGDRERVEMRQRAEGREGGIDGTRDRNRGTRESQGRALAGGSQAEPGRGLTCVRSNRGNGSPLPTTLGPGTGREVGRGSIALRQPAWQVAEGLSMRNRSGPFHAPCERLSGQNAISRGGAWRELG